jgi:hypothetical protein
MVHIFKLNYQLFAVWIQALDLLKKNILQKINQKKNKGPNHGRIRL